MITTIKSTISRFIGQNLTNDEVLTKLATQILTDMDNAVDTTNITQMIFSRHGMALLEAITLDMTSNKIENKCAELYPKIITQCMPYSNGVSLLTLAECIVAIIACGIE
jgi:hypothetical protein